MIVIAITRAIHILSGIIWAGFVVVLATLVLPNLAAEGRGAFGQYMAKSGSRIAGIAAALTLLSGLYLMFRLHSGDHSATAATLGMGALLAIIASITGATISGGAARQLAKLTPGPESAAKANALRDRLILGGRITASLLVLSIICMAVARYV
jgi:hypothetical protein